MSKPHWILALEAVAATSAEVVAKEAENVHPNPSPAQAQAGNYRKAHITWNGLDIAIETPKGGTRRAHDGSWKVENLPAHYGYIKRTEGADGDHVDVYVGDDLDSDAVFVVDQRTLETGKFDETKSMLGFKSLEDAKKAYIGGFSDGKGKDRIQAITTTTVAAFKRWIDSSEHDKAFSQTGTTMKITEARLVEMEEADIVRIMKQYKRNEANNDHTENILLLATEFGNQSDIDIAKAAIAARKNGWRSDDRKQEEIRKQAEAVHKKLFHYIARVYSAKLYNESVKPMWKNALTEATSPEYKALYDQAWEVVAARHNDGDKQLDDEKEWGKYWDGIDKEVSDEVKKLRAQYAPKPPEDIKEGVTGPTRMQLQNRYDALRRTYNIRYCTDKVEQEFGVKNIKIVSGERKNTETIVSFDLVESTRRNLKEAKMKPEHVQSLTAAINKIRDKVDDARNSYAKHGLSPKRFRWDVLHAANWQDLNAAYKYLNDDNIDTVLRSILGESRLREYADDGVIPSEVDTNVDMKILRRSLDTVANDPKYVGLKLAGDDFKDDVEAEYRKDHEADPHDTKSVRVREGRSMAMMLIREAGASAPKIPTNVDRVKAAQEKEKEDLATRQFNAQQVAARQDFAAKQRADAAKKTIKK